MPFLGMTPLRGVPRLLCVGEHTWAQRLSEVRFFNTWESRIYYILTKQNVLRLDIHMAIQMASLPSVRQRWAVHLHTYGEYYVGKNDIFAMEG